ncbi:MAG TPA: hypothetical protein V6D47_02310, partial [Oscillatoriaceae cyanobacterium]
RRAEQLRRELSRPSFIHSSTRSPAPHGLDFLIGGRFETEKDRLVEGSPFRCQREIYQSFELLRLRLGGATGARMPEAS